MFGFLAPGSHELWYRSLYSRCCQYQRSELGLLSLPWLSYESVFLYALGRDLGLSSGFSPPARQCCMLRKDAPGVTAPDNSLGRLVAAASGLFTAIKLADEVQDATSRIGRWHSRVKVRLLDRRLEHARALLVQHDPGFLSRLAGYLEQQATAERLAATTSLADFSRPTSHAFADLLALLARLEGGAGFAKDLQDVGRQIGTAIVLHDCATDWQTDSRYKLPNPVQDAATAAVAAEMAASALTEARRLTCLLVGEQAASTAILTAVQDRLLSTASRDRTFNVSNTCTSCSQPASGGMVLNATCCIPCGGGALLVDSKEAGNCCLQFSCGSCCWGCICYWCCTTQWK